MQKTFTEALLDWIPLENLAHIGYPDMLFIFLTLCFCIGLGYVWGRFVRHRAVMRERSDAVGRSRSVILGELYETIAPLMPGFRYAPRDMVFIGKGVDYLVFDGLSEGNLREIVFLELKTGKSKQNPNEKTIEQCIKKGNVRYELERKN